MASSIMNRPQRPRRTLLILLLVPYTMGLIWTFVHPILSIVTGEAKCRGAFVDENALDPTHFRLDPAAYSNNHTRIATDDRDDGMEAMSLCQSIRGMGRTVHLHNTIDCVASSDGKWQVASIVPLSHIAPTAETIVVVVPYPHDVTTGSKKASNTRIFFANALLELFRRLSSRQTSPWLAKTVLFVSPCKPNDTNNGTTTRSIRSSEEHERSLQSTVDSFLDAYLGRTTKGSLVLPLHMTTGMLRQLLVLDVITVTDNNNDGDAATAVPWLELQILPQGRRGTLPNMDLVFVTTTLYGRMMRGLGGHPTQKEGGGAVIMRVHSSGPASRQWRAFVNRWLPQSTSWLSRSGWWYTWLVELGELALFAKDLVFVRYAPHASALERGVDALTLQLRITDAPRSFSSSQQQQQQQQQFILDYVQTTELLLRTLSNLHERLHHSMTQYLLPSPTKFVSHGEYLLPNLLLLLPMVVRAVTLLFTDITQLDWLALRSAVGVMGVAGMLGVASNGFIVQPTAMAALYAAVYAIQIQTQFLSPKDPQSLQLASCLLAIYLHVPLVLGHVALSWPSSVLWSLVVAVVPSNHNIYDDDGKSRYRCLILWLLLLVLWPPSILVPTLFGTYTPYVTLVYTPLHLLLTIQWAMKQQLQ